MRVSVSVCMAAFNGAAYIREQIASILVSDKIGELIVSDDGSTDSTRDIVAEFGDSRVVLLDGPRAGLVRNFEHALMHAKGEVIFLSDQDDVWLPNRVERVLAAMQGADLVVTDCRVVNAALCDVYPSFFRLNRSGPGVLRNLIKNGYLGCCMAMRRQVLEMALPFPPKVAMHDWWLGLVADYVGRVQFIDEPLVLYRRHAWNASMTSQRSSTPLLRRLYWRLYLAKFLIRRCFGRCMESPAQ